MKPILAGNYTFTEVALTFVLNLSKLNITRHTFSISNYLL